MSCRCYPAGIAQHANMEPPLRRGRGRRGLSPRGRSVWKVQRGSACRPTPSGLGAGRAAGPGPTRDYGGQDLFVKGCGVAAPPAL